MRALLAVIVVVSGCTFPGAPADGQTCKTAVDVVAECVTPSVVAFCESDKWKAYPCPGECRPQQGGASRCDWSSAAAGDACPSMYMPAFCASPTEFVRCTNGKVEHQTCRACPSDC